MLSRAIRLAAPRLIAELIRVSGPATPAAKPSIHACAAVSVAAIVTSFCLASSSLPPEICNIAAHCSGLAFLRSSIELAAICSRAELITSASTSSALPTELKNTLLRIRTVCAVLAHPAAAAGAAAALTPGIAIAAVKPRLITVVPAATATEPALSVRSVVGYCNARVAESHIFDSDVVNDLSFGSYLTASCSVSKAKLSISRCCSALKPARQSVASLLFFSKSL